GVAGVASRLLLGRELAGTLLFLGLQLGELFLLGLARRIGGRLALGLALLARDAGFQHGGLSLGEVFVGLLVGAKLFEQGALGLRGIGLAVQVFGLSLEEAHFIPCCSGWARGLRSPRRRLDRSGEKWSAAAPASHTPDN